MNYHKSYKFHKNYDGKEHWYDDALLNNENTTYLTFQQFITLYTADSENWHFIEKEKSYETFFSSLIWEEWNYPTTIFYIPYYTYENKTIRYIKFLTKKDYKKFVKTLKNNTKKGLDYENQKEILELTQSIQTRSNQKLLEAQKEVQKAYDEHIDLIQKIKEGTF